MGCTIFCCDVKGLSTGIGNALIGFLSSCCSTVPAGAFRPKDIRRLIRLLLLAGPVIVIRRVSRSTLPATTATDGIGTPGFPTFVTIEALFGGTYKDGILVGIVEPAEEEEAMGSLAFNTIFWGCCCGGGFGIRLAPSDGKADGAVGVWTSG